MVDGRTQIYDSAFEPAGSISNWGSDLAGTEARCGGGTQVLATRPGDGSETDAVQVFGIVNRSPMALAPPVGFQARSPRSGLRAGLRQLPSRGILERENMRRIPLQWLAAFSLLIAEAALAATRPHYGGCSGSKSAKLWRPPTRRSSDAVWPS